MNTKAIRLAVICLLWTLWCLGTPRLITADGLDTGMISEDKSSISSVNIYKFDFEAVIPRDNDEWLPARWEKVATQENSPDYNLDHPFYNKGRIVRETENGKVINHYLEMVLHRGKVSYQTKVRIKDKESEETKQEKRFIPVNTEKSYRLTAKIRTEGFEQPDRPTSAFVSILWFYKADDASICRYLSGDPIIFHTNAVLHNTGDQWRDVALTVDTVPPGARFLKLRCTLEGKGIKAKAMFDDVVLSEEPRIIMNVGRPVPIFAGDERIEATFSVNGLSAGEYTEHILTEDCEDGRVLYKDVREFSVDAAGEIVRKYRLNLKSFGSFRLRYILSDKAGDEVGVRSIVIARIPENNPLKNMDLYGLRFDFFENPYPVVGNFVRASHAGSIKTPLWGGGEAQEELLRFLLSMRRMSVATVGTLGRSPEELTSVLGLSVPLQGCALFNQPDGEKRDVLWKYLKEDLAKWADVLEAVQPGDDFDTPYTSPVDGIVAAFAREMARPLSSAALVFPASMVAGAPWPKGAAIVSLSVPAALTRQALAERLSEAPDSLSLWVSLELMPEGSAQIDDFIRKTVVCLAAGVDRIFLPLDAQDAGMIRVVDYPNESGELRPAFAAFRFVTQMIDGAAPVEEISSPSVRMYLFEKGEESCVVMWSEKGETRLPVYWGEGLIMYDAVGNVTNLPCVNGETVITGLDESPRIISGVDPRLLQTWRSLRFITKSIESRVVEQPVEVGIENHFGEEIFGNVRLEYSEELRHLQPRSSVAEFQIAPGESWSSGGAFVLKPSISDSLGPKPVKAIVEIHSGKGSIILKKTLELEMAPPDLSLSISRITMGGPEEMVVRVNVSNESSSYASVSVYAVVEDGPSRRRRVSIPRLEAGEQAEAEFRLHIDPDSPPSRIWLGLREIYGRRFTNIYIDRETIKDVFNK